MSFLIGTLGFFAALILFGSGFALGAKYEQTTTHIQTKKEETEAEREAALKERRRLQAEQEAFHTVQNYSVERAYGMLLGPESELRGDTH